MKTYFRTLSFFLAFSLFSSSFCSANNDSESIVEIDGDSCLVVLEAEHFRILDSLAAGLNFLTHESMPEELWIQGNEELTLISDSLLEERLSLIPTTIPMSYNRTVRNCIELFVVKNRKHTAKMRGQSSKYFGFFESELEKRGLPHELKYLAVIESAFNPQAVSRAGATGLWQIMFSTGKWLGLRIDTYVDERRDPVKSTEVALDYLSSLYDMYDDWLLAIAAYNSGPGNVNKAIRRAGGLKNFWAIKSYLPRETQSYVPLFIGATYALHFAEDHGIPSLKPDIPYLSTDTIQIFQKRKLAYLAHCMGTETDLLVQCNPSLKIHTIPKSIEGTAVNIPSHLISNFIIHEAAIKSDSLYALFLGLNPEKVAIEESAVVRNSYYYKVRTGDNLGFIAERHGVGLSELKRWNNLRGSRIRAGQSLIIYGNKPKSRSSSSRSNASIHVVRSGETLGLIANKHGLDINDLKRFNGLSSNTIHPGQKLKLKAPSSIAVAQTSNGSGKANYHTVKSGDTLWDIANAYNLSIAQLCSYNNISSRSTLKLGQKLKISAS